MNSGGSPIAENADGLMLTRRRLFILWILITVSWLLFIKPPLHSDDMAMMLVAKSFENIRFFHYSHYAHQIGVELPLLLFNEIFGYGLLSYYVFAYLTFLSFSFSVYAISYLSFLSVRIAFIATAIISCLNTITTESSYVMADIPTTGFFIWSFILFVFAESKDENNFPGKLIAGSAICAFASYACKMTSAPFFIAIPVYELLKNRRIRHSMLFGAVFLGMLTLEFLYDYAVFKDPFIRIHVTARTTGTQVNLPHLYSWSDYFFRVPKAWWSMYEGKLLIIMGMAGLAIGALRRNKILQCFIIGIFPVFCMYAYPVVSWNPLVPAVYLCLRHYISSIVLLAILTAYAASKVGDIIARKIAISVNIIVIPIVIAMLATIFLNNYSNTSNLIIRGATNEYYDVSKAFKPFIAANPEILKIPVYAIYESNFGIYPGFNMLNMIDGSRFAAPPVPFAVLAKQKDLDHYVDMFAAVERTELYDKFLKLSRDTRHRRVLFEQAGITLAAIDAQVENKEEVYRWSKEQIYNSPSPISWPLDTVQAKDLSDSVEFSTRSGHGTPRATVCPEIKAASLSTYKVELTARTEKSSKLSMDFIEYKANGQFSRSATFKSFDFEHGSTSSFDHLFRIREFRTSEDTQRICITIKGFSPRFTIENLIIYRYIEIALS